MAFDGQGRNLNDPAVATRIRKSFEDHSAKTTAAFIPWLLASTNIASSARNAVQLMVDLKFGREPSMYVDLVENASTVQIPSLVVRPNAARDCIRLATDCLAHARRQHQSGLPTPTTSLQDRFFAMKRSLFQTIMNTEDFWWYFIHRMQEGDHRFEAAVVEYNDTYFSRQSKFEPQGMHREALRNGFT